MKKNYIINNLDQDTRLDRWLKRKFTALNQSFIEKNIRKGNIKINNYKTKSNYKIKIKDHIIIYNFSENFYYNKIKKNYKVNVSNDLIRSFEKSIVFENKDFIIINKWSSIACQRGSKIFISIDDIIKKISSNYNLVHRLDKDTSGLLIIAKNLPITKSFGNLFKKHEIEKKYLAICDGVPKKLNSTIKLKIQNKNKIKDNNFSITKYKVLVSKENLSVILFEPLTGKTHQLRIVSQYLGCPIIGDKKYNKSNKNNYTLKLNAYSLKFKINNNIFKFKSKIPRGFFDFFEKNNINFNLKKIK